MTSEIGKGSSSRFQISLRVTEPGAGAAQMALCSVKAAQPGSRRMLASAANLFSMGLDLYCCRATIAHLFLTGVVILLCFGAESPLSGAALLESVSQYRHDVWDESNGLTAGAIHAISQTRDGYLWIGSDHGLYRFDGLHFTRFYRRNTPELRDHSIEALIADGPNLWIGTGVGGLVRYRDGTFRRYGRKEGLLDDHVVSLQLVGGTLWIGTASGVVTFDHGRFTHVLDSTVRGEVTALMKDPKGGIWIAEPGHIVHATGAKVAEYTLAKGGQVDFIYPDAAGDVWLGLGGDYLYRIGNGALQLQQVRRRNDGLPAALLHDRRGRVWIATGEGGLSQSSSVMGPRRQIIHSRASSVDDSFAVLFGDREGSVWAGTRDGKLHRFREMAFTLLTSREGLNSDYIYCVYEDNRGVMWVGTPEGLNRIKDGRISHFTTRDGLPHNHVMAIWGGKSETLWLGTSGGLSQFTNGRFRNFSTKDGLSGNNIRVVIVDRNGTVWAGTDRVGLDALTAGHWRHYGIGTGLAGNSIREIHEDARGVLWVGTGRGLSKFENGASTIYTSQNGLANSSTTVLDEDERHSLWIGTPAGLTRYHDGILTNFGARFGITSPVEQVLVDRQGWIWMAGEDGISRVRRSDLETGAPPIGGQLEAFGLGDGLGTLECSVSTHPLAIRARDGRLWFATPKGLAIVDPALWPGKPAPPPVHIEQFFINDHEVRGGNAHQLEAGSTKIRFQFAAVSLLDAAKVRVRYKLEGVDSAWVEADGRQSASYDRVGPGNFRFRVIASTSGGPWSDPSAELSFHIAAYFYQTWWFVAAAAGLLACAVRLLWSHRMRSLLTRQRELELAVAERTEALRVQATHDGLTGVLNRSAILETLGQEILRCQRESGILTIVLADLDYFKRVNDTHGHLVGDAVLLESVTRIAGAIRPYDALGRYGGEEFLLILPGCDLDAAKARIEEVRDMIRSSPVQFGGAAIPVTCSFGVAALQPGSTPGSLIQMADQALYLAKRSGGDRVCRWSDSEEAAMVE